MEPGTPVAGKDDGESRAVVELVKDIPEAPTEAEFREPKNVWTHPEHKYVCLFATVCKLLSIILIVFGCLIHQPFMDQMGDTYGGNDVWCHENGVCMTKDAAETYSAIPYWEGSKLKDFDELKEHSGPLKMIFDQFKYRYKIFNYVYQTTLILPISDFATALFFVLFWTMYLAKGKVLHYYLEAVMAWGMLISWLKFAAGWLLVSAIPKTNHVYMWGTPLTEDRSRLYNHEIYTRALRLSPMMMSMIFLSFILDIVTFAMLIVARDPGIPGMSHRRRLMLQQEARRREEELEAATPRRKSYVPEEMSHHDKIISEMSLNKKGDNLAPGSVAGGGGSALRVVASSTRSGGSTKASMVSTQ